MQNTEPWSNKPATAKPASASVFHAQRPARGLAEPGRWAGLRPLLITLSVFVGAGCAPKQTRQVEAKPNDPRQLSALMEIRSRDAFFRQITPYDSDPAARQVYLEQFYAGYRMATGYSRTCCIFGNIPHREATITGWYDGQLAGELGWVTNESTKPQ